MYKSRTNGTKTVCCRKGLKAGKGSVRGGFLFLQLGSYYLETFFTHRRRFSFLLNIVNLLLIHPGQTHWEQKMNCCAFFPNATLDKSNAMLVIESFSEKNKV